MNNRAVVASVAGSLIIAWAAIFVRLADTTVANSATYRCALAVPILLILMAVKRPQKSEFNRNTVSLSVAAGGGLAGRLLFWHASIAVVGAGMATVLQDLQAVLVPFAVWALYREHPGRRQLISLPVVLLGCLLIGEIIGSDGYGSDPTLGAIYGVTAAFSYTIFQVAGRSAIVGDKVQTMSALVLLTVATAVSAVITAAWGLSQGTLSIPSVESMGWLAALALSVQVVGWLLIVWSMQQLSASFISLVLLLQPLGSLLLAGIVFSENPSIIQWLGIAIVIGGIAYTATGSSKATVEDL